jgi:hypothetical protein
VSAVREATSQKAREVAHPQSFRSTFKDKPALYFPRNVAHPPHASTPTSFKFRPGAAGVFSDRWSDSERQNMNTY